MLTEFDGALHAANPCQKYRLLYKGIKRNALGADTLINTPRSPPGSLYYLLGERQPVFGTDHAMENQRCVLHILATAELSAEEASDD